MSWHFSQALVAEYSAATCSDGAPSAPSNTTPTPETYYWPDKTTEHSRLSRFGMTCEPLTAIPGEELLTLFQADSLARTLAQQEKEQDSTESEADYGPRWHGSFAKYDPATSSWKTAQCSLVEDLEKFSETWPRWGSMRNGGAYLRPTPEHLTGESGSGLWPTPLASDASRGARQSDGKRGISLTEVAAAGGLRLWPTPCARDYRSPNSKPFSERGGGKKGEQLNNAVRFWPTPTAGSSHSGGTLQEWGGSKNWVREADPALARGLLNPEWVEWLMGWPIGWTDLKPLETGRFQEWQRQHSASCLPAANDDEQQQAG